MYPQTVVPLTNSIHKALTDGEDEYGNKVTQLKDEQGKAVYYTANVDKTAWNPGNESGVGKVEELNEVYSYKGDRYVKVTPYAYAENITHRYNYSTDEEPDLIGRSGIRWFKVEPIKWVVLNYDWLPQGTIKDYNDEYSYVDSADAHKTIELYAADVLVGGIPFNPAIDDQTVWDQSFVYKYLNQLFVNEAFPMTGISESKIYNNNGDGTEYDNAAYGVNSNYNHLISDETGINPTTQKIYMLSYYELVNGNSPYVKNGIFADTSGASMTRQVGGTDYARAHNLQIDTNTYVYRYWTRTANSTTNVWRVDGTGGVSGNNYAIRSQYGTRPALQLNEWLC